MICSNKCTYLGAHREKNIVRNRSMELSRTDHVKVMYFPSLKRNLYHGKGEVDVMCLNFSNIFYISLILSYRNLAVWSSCGKSAQILGKCNLKSIQKLVLNNFLTNRNSCIYEVS